MTIHIVILHEEKEIWHQHNHYYADIHNITHTHTRTHTHKQNQLSDVDSPTNIHSIWMFILMALWTFILFTLWMFIL